MQTRNMKTRFLSCAVSVLMMPTLLPAVGLQVYAEPETPEYLTFTAQEPGTSITLDLENGALQYSTDAANWSGYTSGAEIVLNSVGDSVYLRGINNDTWLFSYRHHVEIDGKAACSGNVMTLVDYEHPAYALMGDCCFRYMFYGCTGLTEAPELPATTLAALCYDSMFYDCTGLTEAPELPATTLAYGCYENMFYGCTGLTTAPKLPATTLAFECYSSMFSGCTGLTEAPELPVTTLTFGCYGGMFAGCTSLTTAPKLPATKLADSCYLCMFQGCKGLTAAPVLPATDLADSCYHRMFADCISLTAAPALPATNLADKCYYEMFYGCTGLTAAPALPATTLTNSCYCGMFSVCTGLTAAPALPATTLADSCYYRMFESCKGICLSETQTEDYTNAYSVPSFGTGTTANNALTHMFQNTGGTFTGTPEINKTYYMKSNKLTQPEYKQTAKKDGVFYTRFVFVTPKSEIVGKHNAKFTVTYNNTAYTFKTNKYYTGVTSNGVTYVPADENSVLFVVTVTSGSNISADLTCKLDFE